MFYLKRIDKKGSIGSAANRKQGKVWNIMAEYCTSTSRMPRIIMLSFSGPRFLVILQRKTKAVHLEMKTEVKHEFYLVVL